MGYRKAVEILPEELLLLIQDYVDGEYLYIPRKAINKKQWGELSQSKQEICNRNNRIFERYVEGASVEELTKEFYLSSKSIQRIILQLKRRNREKQA